VRRLRHLPHDLFDGTDELCHVGRKEPADVADAERVHLRQLAGIDDNHALGMEWLLALVIPRLQWPKPVFKAKRVITAAEHAAIIQREQNSERRDFYELLWHTGAAQSEGACLRAGRSRPCHPVLLRLRGCTHGRAPEGGVPKTCEPHSLVI